MELLRALVLLSLALLAHGRDTDLSRDSFPKGFVFGTASSAYQVEGNALKYGRGPCIWDTFLKFPGQDPWCHSRQRHRQRDRRRVPSLHGRCGQHGEGGLRRLPLLHLLVAHFPQWDREDQQRRRGLLPPAHQLHARQQDHSVCGALPLRPAGGPQQPVQRLAQPQGRARLREFRRLLLQDVRRPGEELVHHQRAADDGLARLRRRLLRARQVHRLPVRRQLRHRALHRRPPPPPRARRRRQDIPGQVRARAEGHHRHPPGLRVVRAADLHRGGRVRGPQGEGVHPWLVHAPDHLRPLPGDDAEAGGGEAAQLHRGAEQAGAGLGGRHRDQPLHHLLRQAPREPDAHELRHRLAGRASLRAQRRADRKTGVLEMAVRGALGILQGGDAREEQVQGPRDPDRRERHRPVGQRHAAARALRHLQDRLLRPVPPRAEARHHRRRQGDGLLRVVAAGQLRVADGLHLQVRPRLRRPQHLHPVPQGLHALVPEGDQERGVKEPLVPPR